MDVVHENVPKKTACRCEFVFLDHCFFTPLFLEQIENKMQCPHKVGDSNTFIVHLFGQKQQK